MMALKAISNSGASNSVAELKQLAFEFAVAPAGILSGQAHNQRFQFRRHARPACSFLLVKGPASAAPVLDATAAPSPV